MTTFKDLVVSELLVHAAEHEKIAEETASKAEYSLHMTVAGLLKAAAEDDTLLNEHVI